MPNKYITANDKGPVWMNENIKSKNQNKKLALQTVYTDC